MVLHRGLAEPLLRGQRRHAPARLLAGEAGERPGVDQHPVVGERLLEQVAGREALPPGGLDDDANGEPVRAGELEVALVVGRDAHDGPGAVPGQHEVISGTRYSPFSSFRSVLNPFII